MSKRTYNRLSPAIWAEVEAKWQTGEATLSELSHEYGVTRRTLQAHFRRNEIQKGERAEVLTAAAREMVFGKDLDDRSTRLAMGKQARAAALQSANRIEQLIMVQVESALKDSASAFRASAAIKALALAAQAVERLYGVKAKALDLDKLELIEDLPELIIRDLSEERLRELREASEDEELQIGQMPIATPYDEDDIVVLNG